MITVFAVLYGNQVHTVMRLYMILVFQPGICDMQLIKKIVHCTEAMKLEP